MKEIKLFLASSTELKNDREQFEILIGRLNKRQINDGIFIKLIIWEDFLDSVSQISLQSEYNKAILECDIFVMLFFTKVGKYTSKEFETAFGKFKENNRPFIFTYFKNAEVSTSQLNKKDTLSLFSFQERMKELGHFYTMYNSIEDLKLKFSNQINKLKDQKFFEKKIIVSEDFKSVKEKLESNDFENGMLDLRKIVFNKLVQIADEKGNSKENEPPMNVLRFLASMNYLPDEVNKALEFSLSVTGKVLNGIIIQRVEAVDVLIKTSHAFDLLKSVTPIETSKLKVSAFHIMQTKHGEFFYNLKNKQLKILLKCDPYASKASLLNGIESVKINAKRDYRFKRGTSRTRMHFFRLTAANGEIIGMSNMYSSSEEMESEINEVVLLAPLSGIIDEYKEK